MSAAASPSVLGVRHTAALPGLPAGACDCHVHVLGPYARYPLDPGRGYTPREASLEQLLAHQAALGFERVVLVQPSAYGTDNSRLRDALHALGASARGVAVIDAGMSDAVLRDLHDAGVRGVRLNLETSGKNDPQAASQQLSAMARRVAPLGWHIQIYANLRMIQALHDTLAGLPVPVVIDHFGKARAALGRGQPGFDALLSLLASGRVWIKLSGAHRISDLPDCEDAQALVGVFSEINDERLIWGSDWPHTGAWPGVPFIRDTINEFHPVDDGHAVNRLRRWLGDDALIRKVLAGNAKQLYGFG